jgi:hypothetical protein
VSLYADQKDEEMFGGTGFLPYLCSVKIKQTASERMSNQNRIITIKKIKHYDNYRFLHRIARFIISIEHQHQDQAV